MSIEELARRQNPDGGWPYQCGRSWTEPTVYSILAMTAAGETARAEKGLEWLRSMQHSDGGWPPQAAVEESTWVTALAALVPEETLGAERHARAIRWLGEISGRETSVTHRLRERMLGVKAPPEQEHAGWPWIPGAAAWVGPTALAILALEKEQRKRARPHLEERIREGREFLIARMCREGGWNHGSVRALGYESAPYPETTGMALAALGGVKGAEVERALRVARRFLEECRSADALNWLRLGLRAHAHLPENYRAPEGIRYRTSTEISLNVLASRADYSRSVLWS